MNKNNNIFFVRNIAFFVCFYILLSCVSTNVYSQELIDDFTTAHQSGSTISSNSRIWYSFGGIQIELKNNRINAIGRNLNAWSGFGIDPGPGGGNGAIITPKGYSFIVVELDGATSNSKLEVYDRSYHLSVYWIPNGQKIIRSKLPYDCRNGISKIQFVCAPGNVNLIVKRIFFE
jgi:hypothetical protein